MLGFYKYRDVSQKEADNFWDKYEKDKSITLPEL